jgi:sarcosine oxidase subunit beta
MAQVDGAEVVIIGAGVTGLASAWFLAKSGVDVIVIEKGVIGYEASSRNGGICAYHRGVEPKGLMGYEETKLWHNLEEELGYPLEFVRGNIGVALDEDDFELVKRGVERTNSLGWRTEVMDADTIKKHMPIVSPTVAGGRYDPDSGHANPQRTVQAYAWAAQDHGARIYQHTQATGFKLQGDKVISVETDKGDFGCSFVVNSAGPQVGLLTDMVGGFIPLAQGRVEIIVTVPLERMWQGAVGGNGLYGRQTERGNLAYGGGNQEWVDVDNDTPEKPNTPLIRNVGRRLAELMPAVEHVPVIRTWAGVVEQTPDYSPIIDIADHPNNFLVCTLSADGFGLSPATGKAVSELVLHGESTIPTDHMNLGRFADVPRTWREDRGWTPAQDRT